jgi:hypothetical protein
MYSPSGETGGELTASINRTQTQSTDQNLPVPVSHPYIATLQDSLRKACNPHPELHWLPDRYFEATVAAMPPGNDIPDVYKAELEVFSEALS